MRIKPFLITLLQQQGMLLCVLFSWVHLSAQSQTTDSSFFLPEDYFTARSYKRTQNSNQVHTYVSTKAGAVAYMLFDIRWVFVNSKEALAYYNKNLAEQSEGGFPYIKEVYLPNASQVKVYREARGIGSMMQMMGVTDPVCHWNFIFLVDKVMVKLYVTGDLQFQEAYLMAYDAAALISKALGLPVDEAKKSKINTALQTSFKARLQAASLKFSPPYGFEHSAMQAPLEQYFDQELKFGNAKVVQRWYIPPNSGSYDVSSLADLQKAAGMCYLSIAPNIMLSTAELPPVKDNKDTLYCKKVFNGDYFIASYFKVNKKSELAKGYDYCYMYAVFKRYKAPCFVFYLFDDPEFINAFPHLLHTSVRYE